MSIPAIRNKLLTLDTHVGVIDLTAPVSPDPYNLQGLDILETDIDLGEFTSPLTQTIPPLPSIKPAFSDLTRLSASGMSSITDLSKINDKQILSRVEGLLPDGAAGNMVKGLSKACLTKGMNGFDLGRPYDNSVNCGGHNTRGRSGGCANGNFSNILSKLTGGAYNSSFSNINNILRGLVGLTKLGMDMSLCGVFTALGNKYAGVLTKDMLGKAGASVLGFASGTQNMKGVFDLASSTTGVVGALAGKLNQKGVKDILAIKTAPLGVREVNFATHAEAITESVSVFDSGWGVSKLDGLPSARLLSENNPLNTRVFQAGSLAKTVTAADVGIVKSNSYDLMAMASKSLGLGAGKLKLFGG
jgi:hypothetical protein